MNRPPAAAGWRRVWRTAWRLAAVVAAAGAVSIAVTLPPPTLRLLGELPRTEVAGGYHIHTVRSDGSGTVDEVAAAAARAGLSFIIVTDHGDARRRSDPPVYKSGVLYIDTVEVGTTGGHIVALGLTGPAPYPLGGSPRDVLDDIHRLGGVAIIAHPDSATVGLSYRGPDSGFEGIEWLNLDSEWRDKSSATLVETALHYLIRPPESVASLLRRPSRTLARWDAAALTRPVFGLAALDAHARVGWRTRVEPRTGPSINRPTYEAMFRALAQVVVLDAPLSGTAAVDASSVLNAIRLGHSFSVIRGLAGPASLEFTARQGTAVATMGDRLGVSADATTFHAVVRPDAAARVVLLCDGRELAEGRGAVDYSRLTSPGVYRIEAWLPNTSVPWIVSNPITVAPPPASVAAPDNQAFEATAVPLDTTAWRVEQQPSSTGHLAEVAEGLQFDFRLASGQPAAQYAALVTSFPADQGVRRVRFTVRADEPIRVSVQLRQAASAGAGRWRRSVYVDATSRSFVLPVSDFEPVETTTPGSLGAPGAMTVADVDSLLFVVDTVNTPPGTPGTLWISQVAIER